MPDPYEHSIVTISNLTKSLLTATGSAVRLPNSLPTGPKDQTLSNICTSALNEVSISGVMEALVLLIAPIRSALVTTAAPP
jgi:uncharacterized membrane protein YczE